MTISLNGLHQQLRPYAEYALQIANQYGLKPEVTSVYRALDFQLKLRNNWELCVKKGLYPSHVSLSPGMSCAYPANKPGDSGHNYRLAWDSWVPEDQMPLWRDIRRYVGWQVPDNDLVHAELPNWRSYVSS